MGKPVHLMNPIMLHDEEGLIGIITEGEQRPNEKDFDSTMLLGTQSILIFTHEPSCRGHFNIVKVSDSKTALFCPKCGLRLTFKNVTTLSELKESLR